jgi:Family of unknown function (DUF5681)
MRFQPGQSGNPAGRPPGSRNQKTIALEEAFEEHVEDILKEVVGRAKEGEKNAMRLCMERMLAPKRERPVVIDLPVIETPADARKALAVVTTELAEGNLTITEATRLIGLIQRMLRLVGQIEEMEKTDREENDARALGRSVGEAMEAYLAREEEMETPPEPTQTGAPGDPLLYSPVNSQIEPPQTGPGGENGALPGAVPRETEAPPLPRAA